MNWIVGLGNPGEKYRNTRHNIGFTVLDRIADKYGVAFKWKIVYAARCCSVKEKALYLVKPETYMNRSGAALSRLRLWKRFAIDKLIVVVDDTELAPGKIRIRKKGSAGGHNGLKSVNAYLGTEDYVRIRVGIGKELNENGLIDHVLSGFNPEELPVMEQGIKQAAEAVEYIIEYGVDRAMNKFN